MGRQGGGRENRIPGYRVQTVTIESEIPHKYNGVSLFSEIRFPFFLPRHVAPLVHRNPPGRLHRCFSLHKAPAHSSRFHAPPHIQIGDHTEKTKDLLPHHHPCNQKRPRPTRGPQKWIPRVPKQGKERNAQLSSRPPSSRPSSLGRKQEG